MTVLPGKSIKFLVLTLALGFGQVSRSQPEMSAAEKCEAFLKKESFGNLLRNKPSGTKTLRYPQGVNTTTHPDWFIQFGFESEYLPSEIEKMLEVYGPDPEKFGISPELWFQKPLAERHQWALDNLNALFPESRKKGFLVKLRATQELAFLPDRLIRDTTGNVEIILAPFDTLEEWFLAVTHLNEKFGAGSMQATVSSVGDSFFGRLPGLSIDEIVRQNIGFFNFMNEMDTINKLQSGAVRFASDSTKPVVRSFVHPFLGPMSLHKQRYLERFVRENASGRMFDKETLDQVSGMDSSFKYISGTAYRPDIVGPDKIVLEVRDCHKTLDCLIERIFRSVHYLQKGREDFRNAEIFKAFDAVSDYQKFPEEVRKLLESLYPMRANPSELSEEEILSHQVYRNFSYPLKDWVLQIFFLGRTEIQDQILSAQNRYVEKLKAISRDFENKKITTDEAIAQTQGALAQFSIDSGLADAFEDWLREELIFTESGKPLSRPPAEKSQFRAIITQANSSFRRALSIQRTESLGTISRLSEDGLVLSVDSSVPEWYTSSRGQTVNLIDLLSSYHLVLRGLNQIMETNLEEAQRAATRTVQASLRVRNIDFAEFELFVLQLKETISRNPPINAGHSPYDFHLLSPEVEE